MKNIKLYPLSDGKYIVSYFDSIRKKRVQKNFTEELKAKAYVSALRNPPKPSAELDFLKTASVETALRTYLEKVPNTYLSKSPKLIREFLDFFSAFGVPRLSEANLREFFTQLKNENDPSDRSLLSAKSMLQGFFKFLIANAAIDASPLDGIKFDRGAPFKRKPTLFDDKAIMSLIETARRKSPALFYPIFLLIYETAAKTADIINLQWKDVNFKDSRIDLIRSTEIRPRSFTISIELLNSIRRMERVCDHVFTTLEGRTQKKHILGRELKKFQRQAGFDTKWGLRDLRASYGTNFLKRGGSMVELQTRMGHSQLGQTKEIFTRLASLKSNLIDPTAVQETG
jgi:integrase